MSKIKSLIDGDGSTFNIEDGEIVIRGDNGLVVTVFPLGNVTDLIKTHSLKSDISNNSLITMDFSAYNDYHYHQLMSVVEMRKILRYLYTNHIQGNIVYLGEIEGKHSEVYFTSKELNLSVLTDGNDILEYVTKNGDYQDDACLYDQWDYGVEERYSKDDVELFNSTSLEELHTESDYKLVSDEVIESLKLSDGETDYMIDMDNYI